VLILSEISSSTEDVLLFDACTLTSLRPTKQQKKKNAQNDTTKIPTSKNVVKTIKPHLRPARAACPTHSIHSDWLTPCSRFFLDKLTVSQPIKCNPKAHSRTHNSPSRIPKLNSAPSVLFKNHHTILPSTLTSRQWSLPHQNTLYVGLITLLIFRFDHYFWSFSYSIFLQSLVTSVHSPSSFASLHVKLFIPLFII
jgi:hypothetical protein